jgi:hypothetical protein
MKKFTLAAIIGGAILSVVPATASTTTFNFATGQAGITGQSYGDTLSYTVGGITVTETAWYVNAGYGSSTKFGAAAVDNYSGATLGLGVCSPNDTGGTSCGSPTHQVDNAGGTDEFVLFTFSGGTVSLGAGSAIQVTNYAPDGGSSTAVDLTYYSAATAITTNTAMSAEGTGITVTGNNGSGTPVVYSNLTGGTTLQYLLVGAAIGMSSDAFKINDLIVNNGTNPSLAGTPEPATFGLIGLALAGLGIYGRKRKSRNR